MSYVPPASALGGLSLPAAESYGKPHVGCLYGRDDVRSLVLDRRDGPVCCAVCGRLARNAHHEPAGRRHLLMRTKMGAHVLKPAGFALCGSGTTGCHGRRHSGLIRIEWRWDRDDYAEAWWTGTMLLEIDPHSKALYAFGRWVVTEGESEWEIRCTS